MPALPNIMKAKKKPLDETSPETLGVDVAPRLKVLKTAEPRRPQGRRQGRLGRRTGRRSSRPKPACSEKD